MNKKGSLNLSIQAIVIVVIAFVVLGLSLGFVRTQFGEFGKTSTAVQEQIGQQILDDLRTGNKKLSFPATKLTIETGEESVQAIGLKNTKDSAVHLRLGFQVKGTGADCDAARGFCTFVSEQKLDFATPNNPDVTALIIWDNSPQSFKQGQPKVIPVTITAPDKTGNFLYKVVVHEVTEGGDYIGEFDTRTFFIKTS